MDKLIDSSLPTVKVVVTELPNVLLLKNVCKLNHNPSESDCPIYSGWINLFPSIIIVKIWWSSH